MSDQADGTDKSLRFDEAVDKLQDIIERIESGEVPLEESIERYAEGVELLRHCRAILEKAEKKIAKLSRTSDGKLKPDGEVKPVDSGDPTAG